MSFDLNNILTSLIGSYMNYNGLDRVKAGFYKKIDFIPDLTWEIFTACEYGHIDLLSYFLTIKPSADINEGLFKGIELGRREIVKLLLSEAKHSIDYEFCLYNAFKNGDMEIVNLFPLREGYDNMIKIQGAIAGNNVHLLSLAGIDKVRNRNIRICPYCTSVEIIDYFKERNIPYVSIVCHDH